MVLVAVGFVLFTRLGVDTPYWYVLARARSRSMTGMALSMSPMTASIMSAVPASRAGAGSAMNDATRELGAALGVAVLGSVAASQYSSHLHDAARQAPGRGARRRELVARRRARTPPSSSPVRPPTRFATVARTAFVDGIHLAAMFGVVLAVVAALLTRRFLPRDVAPTGAMHSPVEALENAAEFGIGGAMPVFADDPRVEERVGSDATPARH